MKMHVLLTTVLLGVFLACDAPAQQPLAATALRGRSYDPPRDTYAFVPNDGPHVRLADAFSPPPGFRRVDLEADAFGTWLRGLPLRADRTTVLSFRGEPLRSPSAAVVAMDVGSKNLQQCADSAIRLHAEWLWAIRRTDDLAYHFTSGDEVHYPSWVLGERISVDGAQVRRGEGPSRRDDHTSFRAWLDLVFMYAGTRSLARDSVPVEPREIAPGDFFVAPGSPGHAVVVLDVAKHRDGRRVALLGQGFMPAQEFHVLRSEGRHVVNGTWFLLPETADDVLRTPSWKPFAGADARRFTAP